MVRRARQHPRLCSMPPEPLALLSLPDLTAERWEHLRPFLPPQARTGRPAIEHRLMVEGLLWMMRTGASWRDLPPRFGPWQTISSRYQRWRKEGRWQSMLQILQQPEIPLLSSA
ncbi:MAG: transposase [Ktedonobacteraceae bacterium]